MMKIKFLLFVLMFFFFQKSNAQSLDELNQFNVERNAISKKGMLVLGAWGVGNIIAGAAGYTTTNAEVDKNFHEMNIFWGGINLVLATTGYLGAANDKKNYDLTKSMKAQNSIEKTFLANAALDVVYVTAGLYLTEKSKNEINRKAMYKGFGQSIMVQGAFLFCFDACMFYIENKHGNKKLYRFLDKVNLSSNGIGLLYKI